MITQSQIARFWSRVDKSGECWLWTGGRKDSGYGVTYVLGRYMPAHRVSYLIENGDIPAGAYICHHCDNRPCVRPEHLYAGDAFTNATDTRMRRRLAATGRPVGQRSTGRAVHPRQLSESVLASAVLWRAARVELGLSQFRLSIALDCSSMTVANAESGTSTPAPALLARLHALLDQSRALRASLPAGERVHSLGT